MEFAIDVRGLIDWEIELLIDYAVSEILPKGGTIIGTSRTKPYKNLEKAQKLKDNLKRFSFEVIAIGGDDTLSVSLHLHEEGRPIVGMPNNINDNLNGTAYTFF